MAFAFGFPQDVTDLIYSMRDWRWEFVRDGGKAPSARCFDVRPMSCDYWGVQPRIYAYDLPKVLIESDEEEEDYGEIVCTEKYLQWYNDINICIHDEGARKFWHVTLRQQGRQPAKFRRLHNENERRIKEAWLSR